MTSEATPQNAWVDSYLNALLTYGLSSEYANQPKSAKSDKSENDRLTYNRFYVQNLLKLNEESLSSAWLKAAAVTKQGNDKDARMQYLSWRIWFLKRKHAAVLRARGEHDDDAGHGGEEHELTDEESAPDLGAPPAPAPRQSRAPRRSASYTKLAALSLSPEPRLSPGAAAGKEGGAAASAGSGEEPAAGKPSRGSGVKFATAFEEFQPGSGPSSAVPGPGAVVPSSFGGKESGVYDRLYVIMISLHGLVRGEAMELGRDSDTGGQVKYVVELTKAMALHPAVHRVELLTRRICDPSVDASYGVEEEQLAPGAGDTGGAYIVRLPCGPPDEYVRKELLWPHVREFADRAIEHAGAQLARMAEAGRRCELYAVHGHYADAGEVAVLVASSLDVPMVMTGHSLGRNKLEHLLKGGGLTRREIEETYAITRRIEAEERALDCALMVFTSTQQEVDEQWGLYDGFNPQLARVLHFRRSFGRHMPLMRVSPPGLDFSNLKVTIPEDPVVKEFAAQRAAFAERELAPQTSHLSSVSSDAEHGDKPAAKQVTPTPTPPLTPRGGVETLDPAVALIPEGPPIWQDIARFLRNPLKPAILAMSRPDPKKNLLTLVRVFGESPMLRRLANLVLIMGNRDDIDSMSGGSQKVLTQVLKLIDKYDLHGSVAYPKHHSQSDISDIYKFAVATRGLFTNIALQEPFGLTVIEAAAHGAPTVATKNGGPVDIMATLHHGVVVDPTDPPAITAALLGILTNPELWDEMSRNGVDNIMAYSWPSHVKRYIEAVDSEVRFIRSYRRHDRTMSGLLDARLAKTALEDVDGETAVAAAAKNMERGFSMPHPRALQAKSATVAGGATATGGMTPPQSGTPSASALRRNISGFSNDDLAVAASRGASDLHARAGQLPLLLERQGLVFVTLDAEAAAPAAAAALRALQAGSEARGVGVGVLSMLGFDLSRQVLEGEGVDVAGLDAMVCNAGADVWLQARGGDWDSEEGYQALIEFEWDRTSLHRTLGKVVSRPAGDAATPLPRLKELLYNVVERPEAGVHPRHFCIELDPETRSILSRGMGPRAREAVGPAQAALVADRLKRRLRSKGFRASYTLQLVPRDAGAGDGGEGADADATWRAALHITPVRATRALALRYLARMIGGGLDRITVVLPVPAAAGGVDVSTTPAADLRVASYAADLPDLLAGAQRVVVLPMQADAQVASALEPLTVALEPWASYGDRVGVASSEGLADAVLGKE